MMCTVHPLTIDKAERYELWGGLHVQQFLPVMGASSQSTRPPCTFGHLSPAEDMGKNQHNVASRVAW